MTEQELEKLIEDKYGTYPDDRPGVVSFNRFQNKHDWDIYCQEAMKLLTNLSQKDFFNQFPLLAYRCGASLPWDK